MGRDGELVEIDFDQLVNESDLAWRIRIDGRGDVWLPKSQVEMNEEGHVVMVPEWLAIEKGLV